jgi:hypothetical protein
MLTADSPPPANGLPWCRSAGQVPPNLSREFAPDQAATPCSEDQGAHTCTRLSLLIRRVFANLAGGPDLAPL